MRVLSHSRLKRKKGVEMAVSGWLSIQSGYDGWMCEHHRWGGNGKKSQWVWFVLGKEEGGFRVRFCKEKKTCSSCHGTNSNPVINSNGADEVGDQNEKWGPSVHPELGWLSWNSGGLLFWLLAELGKTKQNKKNVPVWLISQRNQSVTGTRFSAVMATVHQQPRAKPVMQSWS